MAAEWMLSAHPMSYLDLSDLSADETAELCEAIETDEDELQIRIELNGPWHRQEPARRKRTACGVAIRAPMAAGWPAGYSLRQHGYDGPLCPDCFTSFELGLSDEANNKENP